MIKPLKTSIIALAAGILASCVTSAPSEKFSELSYGHLGELSLNVETLKIASDFKPSMGGDNVEHLFPTPPEKALWKWAADRLRAQGSAAQARFVIIDASVIETRLEVEGGITGAFTKEQAVRYSGALEAVLEIVDAKGGRKGFASARVSRSKTLEEGATLNEKERLWFELTEALMSDFNREFEKNIRKFLGDWMM